MNDQTPFTPPVDPEKEKQRQDLHDKAERARLAKALLEDKAFAYAMLQLRQRWFHTLLEKGGGNSDSVELVAKINALEGLAMELQICINDFKMAMRNG